MIVSSQSANAENHVQTKVKRLANRSRLEIACDVLRLCLVPQKKTKVIYGAGMSCAQANYYLSVLVAKGFLASDMRESVNDSVARPHLITTQLGRETLQSLTDAVELLDSIFANERKMWAVDNVVTDV